VQSANERVGTAGNATPALQQQQKALGTCSLQGEGIQRVHLVIDAMRLCKLSASDKGHAGMQLLPFTGGFCCSGCSLMLLQMLRIRRGLLNRN
jgi:hypothetical protein